MYWVELGTVDETDLVDLSPCLEVVALIMAAQQLESLVHMVPGILDLRDERDKRLSPVLVMSV